MGCGGSAAAEHSPRDLEVKGLNPVGAGLFSSPVLSNFPSLQSVLDQVPQEGVHLNENDVES